jgi:integrase
MGHKHEPSFDSTHGLYHRSVGLDRMGRKPKFWLGSDKRVAHARMERLELLWAQIEADFEELLLEYPNWLESEILRKPERPMWDELTHAAAKSIARGEPSFPLPRKVTWSPYQYALRVMKLQRRFPAVVFTPEDQEFSEVGKEVIRSIATEEIREAQGELAALEGRINGQTLHQGIDAYIARLEKLPDVSGWYRTQRSQCRRLKEHHPDMPLPALGLTKIEEMYDHWRHLPAGIAPATARNHLIQMNMVFKWLHRNEHFAWRKPDGMEDLKMSIRDNGTADKPVETFTVDELRILWEHATPLVRLEMLLALNCGFKQAEISTLRLNEIFLDKPYPGIVRTDRPEGKGNWICRKRRKTKVYGEWSLFPETADGITWARANRKHPVTAQTDTLLVTRSGRTLDQRTDGRNKSDKIYNSWRNLFKTIRAAGRSVRPLPFKNLEKTATDWLRTKFGWEVANLFTSHGKPVKQDTQLEAYSNKPFPALFAALVAWRKHIEPMFASVPEPWKNVAHNRTRPATVAKIKALRANGKTLVEIARAVGLHWATVGKICRG